MQKSQPEIESFEQRLLQLKFAVHRARVHKIRGYLQAMERDFEQLESAIRTIQNMTRSSGHATGTATSAASTHPNAVAISSTPTELPPETASPTVADPISHNLICKQLPHQLALLSTLESCPTCLCGLPLLGRAARDRNDSVSLVVPPNSPHFDSVGSGHLCDTEDDQDICQPVDGLLPDSVPNHFEDHANRFSNACGERESAEPQIWRKDELPQPELYGKKALKQLESATVNPLYAELYDEVPSDANDTVFARLQPHVHFPGTAKDSPSSTDAKIDRQKCEETLGNNAEHAGSISRYMFENRDAEPLMLRQLQQQGPEAIAPATLSTDARGASDIFARNHVRHERNMDENILLRADNCFAARIAHQRLLNARLYTQGVIPGLPWSWEESKGISLWNQFQCNSPARSSSTSSGLSWTRRVHKVGYDSAERRGRDYAVQSTGECDDDYVKERSDSAPEDSLGRAIASINEKRDTLVCPGVALQPDVASEIADAKEAVQLEENNGGSG